MKKMTKREQVTISGASPADFDCKVNEALEEAALRGADVLNIDRRREGGEFLAFIDLVSQVAYSETIMDEYQLQGMCYRCGDCPYLMKSADRRRRYLPCEKGMREETRYNSPACPFFYEALDRGEIVPSDVVKGKEVIHG